MKHFGKLQIEELKAQLFVSDIHDSVFEGIAYDVENKTAMVRTANLITNTKTKIVFKHIQLLVCVNDDKWGNNQAISSLTIEPDLTREKIWRTFSNSDCSECLFLTFQLFSGNEINIICEDVLIEEQPYAL